MSALAIAPLSPLLLDELGLTRAQVGLFLPALYLGGVAMSLPAGCSAAVSVAESQSR